MPTFKGGRVADGAFHGNDPLRPVAVACLATHGSGRIMSALGPIFVKCGTCLAPTPHAQLVQAFIAQLRAVLPRRFTATDLHGSGRALQKGRSAWMLLNDNM